MIRDTLFNSKSVNHALVETADKDQFHSSQNISNLNRKVDNLWIVIVSFIILVGCLVVALIRIIKINRSRNEAYSVLVKQINEQTEKDRKTGELREKYLNSLPEESNRVASDNDNGETNIKMERLLKGISDCMANPEFLFNAEFNLHMLCREVGSNSKYVSSAINTNYGKNFRQLVNELRVREGIRRLNGGECKIQDLAQELGYGSTNNFITAFKSIVGMTPAAYRQTVKRNSRESRP